MKPTIVISIKKIDNLRRVLENEAKFLKIFDKLDNEGSGYLNFVQVTNLLEKFKDGMYKDTVQTSKFFK